MITEPLDESAEVRRLQKIIDGLVDRTARQSELLTRRAEGVQTERERPHWFIYRWRGSGWRVKDWEPDDPVGMTRAEAVARVEQALAAYRRQHKREMYPPLIAWTQPPR